MTCSDIPSNHNITTLNYVVTLVPDLLKSVYTAGILQLKTDYWYLLQIINQ